MISAKRIDVPFMLPKVDAACINWPEYRILSA
jgi:hypothetical protein